MTAGAIHPYKLASVLLQYPTAELLAGLDHVQAIVATCPRRCRAALRRFLAWLQATTPDTVAQHYVTTFDLRRHCALYLTYYRYGDTRKRGMALLAFKAAYRSAGLEPTAAELPDYLPLVLDFAALSPRGERLLESHRADLELLRRAVHQAGSPYGYVIDAVCTQLPRPGRHDLAVIQRTWGREPPREEVGLEPFAPPEYLTSGGSRS